jgi:hypothetical protein
VGIFSRRRPSSSGADTQRQAIDAFWSWWKSEGAAGAATALDQGDPIQVAEALSAQVTTIDPGLNWEVTPGTAARYALVVSCAGLNELRAVARRWRRAAPAPDSVWEYADARLPVADVDSAVLVINDVRLPLTEVMASARVAGAALDVNVFHPSFTDLPEDQRRVATFLLLDQALGEEAVETWLGSVEACRLPPLDPIPLIRLRDVVNQLRERHTDEHGKPIWVLLKGETQQGYPVVASTQVPLRPTTAPHLDTHVAVAVPYTDRNENGFPGPDGLEALYRFEDHLTTRLGDTARLVAHQTQDGVRVLHFYIDGTTPAAEQIRAAVVGWDQGNVEVVVLTDPGWDGVAHLRT